MTVYERLQVATLINAAGTLTRLGGTLLGEPAKRAMVEASSRAVAIEDLQAGASEVISEITGAEAGMVTSGCFAALAIGTAACIARLDVRIMNTLPRYALQAGSEVVICRHHRNSYDRAFEMSGATLVDVGYLDTYLGVGVREVEPEEIGAALTDKTVAIGYVAMEGMGPSLLQVADVAHAANVPVVVDAANQVPPVRNLRRFIAEGADLVAMSGGKALRGPQASGFLFGRRDLITSALLQQVDMDVLPESWSPPSLIDRQRLNGTPRHGFGRGFKVGKEEIAGAVAALEDFVQHEDQRQEEWAAQCRSVERELAGSAELTTRFMSADETGRVPLVEIDFASAAQAKEASRRLRGSSPPVFLNERFVERGRLIFNPVGLGPGQEEIVGRTLFAIATRPEVRNGRGDE